MIGLSMGTDRATSVVLVFGFAGDLSMNVLLQIVYAVLVFVPCFWFALLVLSFWDARRPEEPDEVPEPDEHPMPRPRAVDYVTSRPLLYRFICFLIWPGFVGNWLGRPRRGR